MNKPLELVFATRQTVTLELPLAKNTRILHPEQVILKIGRHYWDVGAFCYAMRSSENRKKGKPCKVVLSSYLKQRPRQVRGLIDALSRLVTNDGKRIATVMSYANHSKAFLDWADANGWHNCLSGSDATRCAYQAWAGDNRERYQRQEFSAQTHNTRLNYIRELLEATTGLEDLHRGTRKVQIRCSPKGGTEPLAEHDFTHAMALNQALFDGICDLVLGRQPFPYKLKLPVTIGWPENHLWLFPAQKLWCLPPHRWGAEREKLKNSYWANDYAAGRVATPDEILHRYAESRFPSGRRKVAKRLIANAQTRIDIANSDERDPVRILLSMVAHNAFLFLFYCNTASNESVAREIETDGKIDAATSNQRYRSIKFRASGKQITLVTPATFMPSLRRFMALRKYLLGDKAFPYLFFTLGNDYAKPARQIGIGSLRSHNNLLCTIDPRLPHMGSRKIRASVADWYQRHHDASITAKVLQNSQRTAQRHYDAGSVNDHREDLSLFLNAVAESAKRQRVTAIKAKAGTRSLEEGGRCESFGHPEALADEVPRKPNCKDSQGCLFCAHRVLVACEEDARKVTSAAFVMEQVILGPQHEEAMRPLITKCDEDLEKIAAFPNCRAMVEWVRKDVFENANLTPFFADKFQLFLELGIIV